MDEEQRDRYECYRRARLKPASVKKVSYWLFLAQDSVLTGHEACCPKPFTEPF